MSARLRAAACVATLAAAAACGDAIVFLGDAPARMRLVAGVPAERGSTLGDDALQSRFQGPQGATLGADGTAYLADAVIARVLRLRPDGSLAALYDLRSCSSPCMLSPAGMALDGAGGLLIADPSGHRVWRMDPQSGVYEPFAGDGTATDGPDGANRLTAGLLAPADVAVGSDGTVYIADGGARRIRSVSPAGIFGTVAGTGTAGDDGDGGPARQARLMRPAGLAVSGSLLFVADSAAQRVRAVSLETGTIDALAGTGDLGFFGDGGDPLEARLNAPVGLAASEDGTTLYIADAGNHRVRVVDREFGVIRTFAGDGGTVFGGDGRTAGQTSLAAPWGLALEGSVLIITDRDLFIVWRTEVLGGGEIVS